MKSIRRRLIVSLMLGICVLFLLFACALYGYIRIVLVRRFDEGLLTLVNTLAGMTETEDQGRLELEFHEKALPGFQFKSDGAFYEVWDASGTVVARSPSLGNSSFEWRHEAKREHQIVNLRLPDGSAGRAVFLYFAPSYHAEEAPENEPSESTQFICLAVAQTRAPLDATLRVILGALVFSGILLPLGAGLVVAGAVQSSLQPLDSMGVQTAAVGPHDLDRRIDTANLPRELEPLGERINGLLERLQAAFSRERRFTRDVAHELRTPLAELQALIEVGRRATPSSETREYFDDALQVTGRMERLVVTLLALARAGNDRPALKLEAVDLTALIGQIWHEYASAAHERGLAATVNLQPVGMVQTNATLVRIIIGNLFSNALAYTQDKGSIEAELERRDAMIIFALENTVDGLHEADLPHLFDPFWRRDEARADAEHAGLGLSIVAAYAETLGMVVTADLPAANRFRMRVMFPLAEK